MAAGWVAGPFTAWLVVMPASVACRAGHRHRPRAGPRSDRGRPATDFGRCRRKPGEPSLMTDDALSCGVPGESAARRGPRLALMVWIVGPIVALTAASIWGEFASHTAPNLLVLDATVGVVACALLPVLLR